MPACDGEHLLADAKHLILSLPHSQGVGWAATRLVWRNSDHHFSAVCLSGERSDGCEDSASCWTNCTGFPSTVRPFNRGSRKAASASSSRGKLWCKVLQLPCIVAFFWELRQAAIVHCQITERGCNNTTRHLQEESLLRLLKWSHHFHRLIKGSVCHVMQVGGYWMLRTKWHP